MSLKKTRKTWEHFGKADPLWGVLSHPGKEGKWEDAEPEFFATGEAEIRKLMQYVDRVRPGIERRRVLDFGCGVGRLTMPLSRYYREAVGIDISAPMIAKAKSYAGKNCRFVLNQRADLKVFEDGYFDLVYSNIVLQHMEPKYAKQYIAEFLRVISPNGLAIFQISSELKHPKRKTLLKRIVPQFVKSWVNARLHPGEVHFDMHGIPQDEVIEVIKGAGGTLIEAREDHEAGEAWYSFTYAAARAEST